MEKIRIQEIVSFLPVVGIDCGRDIGSIHRAVFMEGLAEQVDFAAGILVDRHVLVRNPDKNLLIDGGDRDLQAFFPVQDQFDLQVAVSDVAHQRACQGDLSVISVGSLYNREGGGEGTAVLQKTDFDLFQAFQTDSQLFRHREIENPAVAGNQFIDRIPGAHRTLQPEIVLPVGAPCKQFLVQVFLRKFLHAVKGIEDKTGSRRIIAADYISTGIFIDRGLKDGAFQV